MTSFLKHTQQLTDTGDAGENSVNAVQPVVVEQKSVRGSVITQPQRMAGKCVPEAVQSHCNVLQTLVQVHPMLGFKVTTSFYLI